MKLASALVASVSIVLGIAACAAPEAEQEHIDSTSQALCPRGQICTLPKTGSWWGTSSSGFNEVYDPGTSTSSSGGTTENACNVAPNGTFKCEGPVPSCGTIQKTDGTGICYLEQTCRTGTNGQTECDCHPGCGGGSWGFGSWNPCMYGKTYRCDPWGNCTCSY